MLQQLFGHFNILKRFDLVEYYTKNFEKPIYAAGPQRMIENNPDVAMFFWGKENHIPQIDKMNEILKNDKFDYVACPKSNGEEIAKNFQALL